MFSAGKEKKKESCGLSSEVMHAIIGFSLTITFNLTLGMKWSIIKWNQSCKMASCCSITKYLVSLFILYVLEISMPPPMCKRVNQKAMKLL